MLDNQTVSEPISPPAEDTVKSMTTELCARVVKLAEGVGFNDDDMSHLCDIRYASWQAIKNGYYPDELTFSEFTRMEGIATILELALSTFATGARAHSWMTCKNLQLEGGEYSPFEMITEHDDLERVHDMLVLGDPNQMCLEDLMDG